MAEKRNLPSINDLYNEEVVLSKQNDLNILLNQRPDEKWVKPHPIAKVEVMENGEKKKVPAKYLPIERVEWLLTNIFIRWRTEILREGLLGNSVYCAVRVHYRDPITGEWDWLDGVGACPLQTDSGAGATEFDKLKSSSVQMALPAAKSYAIKDAVEPLGKLFGKDLNRADKIGYDNLAGKFDAKPELSEATQQLIDAIDNLPNNKKADIRGRVTATQKAGKLDLPTVLSYLQEVKNL